MKLIKYFFLAFVLLFSISCDTNDNGGDNNEEETKPNQIEYDGDIYPLSWGMIKTVQVEGVFSTNIELYPSSVLYKSNTGNLSGEGFLFQISKIVSTTLNKSGLYYLEQGEKDPPEAGNFYWAEIFLNASFPIQTEEDYEIHSDLVVEAELEISHIYDEFEITYDAKDDSGVKFSLYYKGSLIESQ